MKIIGILLVVVFVGCAAVDPVYVDAVVMGKVYLAPQVSHSFFGDSLREKWSVIAATDDRAFEFDSIKYYHMYNIGDVVVVRYDANHPKRPWEPKSTVIVRKRNIE